jgi:hypothetical protein
MILVNADSNAPNETMALSLTQMNRILTDLFECPRCARLTWNRGAVFPDRVYSLERERAEQGTPRERGGT